MLWRLVPQAEPNVKQHLVAPSFECFLAAKRVDLLSGLKLLTSHDQQESLIVIAVRLVMGSLVSVVLVK